MLIRPTIKTLFGGDVVLMNETAGAIRKLGHTVDISTDLQPNCTGYDIVHAFNLETPKFTLQQAQRAKSQGVPVVLSSLFFSMPDEARLENFYLYGGFTTIKKFFGTSFTTWVFHKLRKHDLDTQNAVLNNVDRVLPNSKKEGELIQSLFPGAKNIPYSVIIDGVTQQRFTKGDAEKFNRKFGVKKFLLVVGRIGYFKNQLNLLKALRGWQQPIVFIGQHTSKTYSEACKKEVEGRNVHFLPYLPQNEVADAFAAAHVHALPSQKETMGLVSLEAALAGCRIVTSDVGGQREYMKNWAFYCDPNDLASIRTAVEKAWASEPDPAFIEYILKNYTWGQAAQQTLAAYEQVLSAKK